MDIHTTQIRNARLAQVRSDLLWVMFGVYLVIGFGGAFVFSILVHDGVWRDIFYSIWWAPSGLAAYLIKEAIWSRVCNRWLE